MLSATALWPLRVLRANYVYATIGVIVLSVWFSALTRATDPNRPGAMFSYPALTQSELAEAWDEGRLRRRPGYGETLRRARGIEPVADARDFEP